MQWGRRDLRIKHIYVWKATFIHCAALTQTEVIVHQTLCTNSCRVTDCSHRWNRVTFDDCWCIHDFTYCNNYWCINVVHLLGKGKILTLDGSTCLAGPKIALHFPHCFFFFYFFFLFFIHLLFYWANLLYQITRSS